MKIKSLLIGTTIAMIGMLPLTSSAFAHGIHVAQEVSVQALADPGIMTPDSFMEFDVENIALPADQKTSSINPLPDINGSKSSVGMYQMSAIFTASFSPTYHYRC